MSVDDGARKTARLLATLFVDSSAGHTGVYLNGVAGRIMSGDQDAVPVFQGGRYQVIHRLAESVVSAFGGMNGDVEGKWGR